ncbi:MAG: hypothetical protein WC246_03305 [Candidatus Paceibacterota bacterium]|jgi:hypothetical protein
MAAFASLAKIFRRPIGAGAVVDRFVWIRFTQDGIELQGLSRRGAGTPPRQGPRFFIAGVSEKNLGQSKKLAYFLKTIFFPLPYRIIVTLSKETAFATFFTTSYQRTHPKEPLDADELQNIFSHYLWRSLDEHKREAMTKLALDDLSVLLVGNRVVSVCVDGVDIGDGASAAWRAGKCVAVSVVQTFIARSIFVSLQKVLPTRAHIADFVQEDFSLCFIEALVSSRATAARTKNFVFAAVGGIETAMFVYAHDQLAYADSFIFGTQTVYEALNHALGIGQTVFVGLLDVVAGTDRASASTHRALTSFVSQEMTRLAHGVASFKKATGVARATIYAGALQGVCARDKKIAPMLFSVRNRIGDDPAWRALATHIDDDALLADYLAVFGIQTRHVFTQQAMKLVRWLIPHTIDIV